MGKGKNLTQFYLRGDIVKSKKNNNGKLKISKSIYRGIYAMLFISLVLSVILAIGNSIAIKGNYQYLLEDRYSVEIKDIGSDEIELVTGESIKKSSIETFSIIPMGKGNWYSYQSNCLIREAEVYDIIKIWLGFIPLFILTFLMHNYIEDNNIISKKWLKILYIFLGVFGILGVLVFVWFMWG